MQRFRAILTMALALVLAFYPIAQLAGCAPSNNYVAAFKGPIIDAATYGTLSSGADSSTPINDAITAAFTAGGGTVRLPAGTIRCDAQIVLKDKVTLQGIGPGTSLDFSNAGAITDCIKAAGSAATTSVAFNATITKGDTTIAFPSAPSGVAAGSLLLIYNSTDSAFNAARTYYRKGEWVKVKSVSGGTVTLDGPVFDTYTSAGTTSIYLVTPVTASVRNLKATFKDGLTGIKFQYGQGCSADGLDLSGSDLAHVNFDRCFESNATGVKVFDTRASAGTNYGVIIGNSQRVIVSGCMLDVTRHGLAIGGGDFVGCVPNRDILIEGNIINGHLTATNGADIHGNAEHVTYRNNRLLSGISFGGDYITISDNDIRTCNGTSFNGIYGSELLGPNLVIARNRIVATGSLNGANSGGINFSKNSNAWQYAARSGTLKIIDNQIDMVDQDGTGMYVRNGQASDMLASTGTIDLDVSGNRIHGTSNSSLRNGIEIVGQPTGAADKGFRTVRVANNHLVRATIYVNATGARTTSIVNNDIESASVQGIAIQAAANYHGTYQTEEELTTIENNRITRPNKTGILVGGSSTGARSFLFVRHNTAVSCIQGGTTGSTATDASLYAATWAAATIEENVFGKMPNDSTGAQVRFFGLNTITDLYERNNHNVGTVVNNFENLITNRHGGYTYGGTKQISYGTAAPSAGTWAVGDIFWNLAPTAGTAAGWRCTVAGTPGTWEAIAPSLATAQTWTAAQAFSGQVGIGGATVAGAQLAVTHDSATNDAFRAVNTNATYARSWVFGPNSGTVNVFGFRDSTGSVNILGLERSADGGDVHVQTGDLIVDTVGKGVRLKTGSNATMGRATLVGGTILVSTTKATSTANIVLTTQVPGGTVIGAPIIASRVNNTSFTIEAHDATGVLNTLDTSTVAWVIFDESP